MFRQTFVIFRGFIAKVYKNFASIYMLKIPHIRSSKDAKFIATVHKILKC